MLKTSTASFFQNGKFSKPRNPGHPRPRCSHVFAPGSMRYGGWDCSPGSATRGLRCAGGTLWPLRRRWDTDHLWYAKNCLIKIVHKKFHPKIMIIMQLWWTRNRFAATKSCLTTQQGANLPWILCQISAPGWREILVELTSFWAWGQVGWDIQIWFTDLTGNRCNSCNSCKRLRWGLIISTINLEYEVWLSTYYHIYLYPIISYYYIHLSYPLIDSLEVFGFTIFAALRRCRFSGCIPLVLSPVGSTTGKDRPTNSPKTAVKWCLNSPWIPFMFYHL